MAPAESSEEAAEEAGSETATARFSSIVVEDEVPADSEDPESELEEALGEGNDLEKEGSDHQQSDAGAASEEEWSSQDDYCEGEEDGEEEAPEVDEEVDPEEEEPFGGIGGEIDTQNFDEFALEEAMASEVEDAWRLFISTVGSADAAGEAIYSAIREATPTLQHIFQTPRAVMSLRMATTLNFMVTSLRDTVSLKALVETLGFGHLIYDTSIARVMVIRDAILELFSAELGNKFSKPAYIGWARLLNYVGGAIIYVQANYAQRLSILSASWKLANAGATDKTDQEEVPEKKKEEAKKPEPKKPEPKKKAEPKPTAKSAAKASAKASAKKEPAPKEYTRRTSSGHHHKEDGHGEGGKGNEQVARNVPTTFPQMFQFNAAVMGFGNNSWMGEVLACFDNIVVNVANSNRLQEECDILVLRISKVTSSKVNLADFKSCMLASLRSLLPKDWSTEHEVAWSWLWSNVERLLLKTLGYPVKWEKAYQKFFSSLDESQAFEYRAEVYVRFFAVAPAGQDYFKQSNTYLHLIASKVMEMVLEIYRDPVQMSDNISALGLRHVGYGIPTELFGPFVTSCIEVLTTICKDPVCVESFRWSLGLIAKSLVRTIMEGSTIVMQAINSNSRRALSRAAACAPRGERATWMLCVQVGTQSISPLAWSIESGNLEAAQAVIQDLLTIRADRDRYYFGMNEMFKRHHDIVKMLCDNAPALLPQFLDGLIWRARSTVGGYRRVNYYLIHMLTGPDGGFAKNLYWIAKLKDPKIVCHPMIVMITDTVWGSVASKTFLFKKSYFLFSLLIFITCQSILEHSQSIPETTRHKLVFSCRVFIYIGSLGQQASNQFKKFVRDYKKRDFMRVNRWISLPRYLENWLDLCSGCLMTCLSVMLCSEPILWCVNDNISEETGEPTLFLEDCHAAHTLRIFPYSFFSCLATLLYYLLLMDMAVFSTRFSAYVLACSRMLSEVGLFLVALIVVMLTFSCGFSTLQVEVKTFSSIPAGNKGLWELTMQIFDQESVEELSKTYIILFGVYLYLTITSLFLVNMLVAQLSASYGRTFQDMVGFARLRRIQIIVETMPSVSEARWNTFVASLDLKKKLEFNEGDVGICGGIQCTEPAKLHTVTTTTIQRFGGTTSPSQPWPQNESEEDESEKCERVEKFIAKALAKISKAAGTSYRPTSKIGSSSAGTGSDGRGANSSQGSKDSGSQCEDDD